jgi:hypothetical protein
MTFPASANILYRILNSENDTQFTPKLSIIHPIFQDITAHFTFHHCTNWLSLHTKIRHVLYIEDITRRCEDMNFIFEWWKQYFTNERSEWVKYCFYHKKINFISSNRCVMFFLLYSRKQFKNPVSNINFWSIMLKISANYIILFQFKEYLCIILVFSCSIVIFSIKRCCFFFQQTWKLVRRSYTNVAILNTQIHWREMITWSISHCVFFGISLSTI